MDVLAGLAVASALLIGLIGMVFASQATLGVAIIGFACRIAIVARLLQASAHNRALRQDLADSRPRWPA